MNTEHKSLTASRLAMFLALGMAMCGCSTMKLPPQPVQSARDLSQHSSQDGVTIGVQAITDGAETKRRFGADLSKDKILPVLVVIENDNPSASFILLREQTGLRVGDENQEANRERVGSTGTGEALAWTSAGLIIAAPALAIPTLIASGKQTSNASVVKRNFEVNELRSATLEPGGRVQGFLYFPLPKDRFSSAPGTLYIALRESGASGSNRFEFSIQPK